MDNERNVTDDNIIADIANADFIIQEFIRNASPSDKILILIIAILLIALCILILFLRLKK